MLDAAARELLRADLARARAELASAIRSGDVDLARRRRHAVRLLAARWQRFARGLSRQYRDLPDTTGRAE